MDPVESNPTSPELSFRERLTPWKILLPAVIIIFASSVVVFILTSKLETHTQPPVERAVTVEVIEAQRAHAHLSVESQGTVRPRVQTQLTAEVSGRVEEVSPNFRPGGTIREGEVLIRVDSVDYEAAVANAEANLAQAQYNLAQEEAQSEQALADWEDLGRGDPTDLALRVPQMKQAAATVLSAEAALKRARRDLDRTTVRAPYDGRVVEQNVDLGQYVNGNAGTRLGTIYATDVAEVFLPVADDEIARLDLPSALDASEALGPQVTLHANYGGREYTWSARVVRAGAAFDERSRLLDLIAEVSDPLVADPAQPGRPALKPGLFVRADIQGQKADGCFVLPRRALRENNTVLVALPDDTLARRAVTVVQADTRQAIVSEGLEPGDRVIISPLEYVIEGMKLEIEPS